MFGVYYSLGLGAAMGFRVFVPLLLLSVFLQSDTISNISVRSGFDWLATPAAIYIFSIMAVAEIAICYMIRGRILHRLRLVLAVAGAVTVCIAVTGELNPVLQWLLPLGSGMFAGVVHSRTGEKPEYGDETRNIEVHERVIEGGLKAFGAIALSLIVLTFPQVGFLLTLVGVGFLVQDRG
jgi:hypothetical protein